MDEIVSKSQKKRDSLALQDLGKKLSELSGLELDKLPLDQELKQALLFTKTIKSHGALRRHMQWIGKLMRRDDGEAIQNAYDELLTEHRTDTVLFHDIEKWRTALVDGGNEALTAFIDQYAPADIQSLRQLVKKTVNEKHSGKNLGASRSLFRLLREIIS